MWVAGIHNYNSLQFESEPAFQNSYVFLAVTTGDFSAARGGFYEKIDKVNILSAVSLMNNVRMG